MAAGGAGFILRGYGPEYMGGPAVGREVDADVAGPELSTDEIDPVSISCQASKRTRWIVSTDIKPWRRETHSDSWASRNAWLRIWTAEGMAYSS